MIITDGPAPKPERQSRYQATVVHLKDAIESGFGIELLDVSYNGSFGHVSWVLFGVPQEMGLRIDLDKQILLPGDIDELYEKHTISMAQRDFLRKAGERIVEHLVKVEEENEARKDKLMLLTVERIRARRNLEAIEKELEQLLNF